MAGVLVGWAESMHGGLPSHSHSLLIAAASSCSVTQPGRSYCRRKAVGSVTAAAPAPGRDTNPRANPLQPAFPHSQTVAHCSPAKAAVGIETPDSFPCSSPPPVQAVTCHGAGVAVETETPLLPPHSPIKLCVGLGSEAVVDSDL